MKAQEIARNWYMLASEGEIQSEDAFFKFMAVWMAFNALYGMKHSQEGGDRRQVRSYSREYEVRERHRDLIRHDDEYRRAVNVLKEHGVRDSRTEIYEPESSEQAGNGLSQIGNINDSTEVLMGVYQARSNLFHGGKSPLNSRDESLVHAGYVIVSKLIVDDPYLRGR